MKASSKWRYGHSKVYQPDRIDLSWSLALSKTGSIPERGKRAIASALLANKGSRNSETT